MMSTSSSSSIPSTRWTLIIPTNSLYALVEYDKKMKIQKIKGESSVGGTMESIPITMEDGTIIGQISDKTSRFGTLDYNFTAGEKTIEDIYNTFVNSTGIIDVKISEFVYIVRNLDLGYAKETIRCTYKKFTLHAGIFSDHVMDGELPHQEIMKLQKAIYDGMKELPLGFKRTPSFLLLETYPDIHDDGPGIWALQLRSNAGREYTHLIEEKTKAWILKDLAYKKRGGPK